MADGNHRIRAEIKLMALASVARTRKTLSWISFSREAKSTLATPFSSFTAALTFFRSGHPISIEQCMENGYLIGIALRTISSIPTLKILTYEHKV